MLNGLFSLDHTSDNTAAIYGEHLLFNQTLSSKAFYKFAKFIYVFDNAKSSLNKIINHKNEYAHLGAFRYYCFRLRRLFEMACNTPGAVLLTGDDLREQKGAELIENYLDVSVDFSKLELDDTFESVVSASIVEEAQDCYERYLYKMKQLDLKYEA
ncbi:MAG: hypothetical protein DWQ19_12350 [Crenarchaeota archaeon]|nr:MAG: hypothetical protein DWQ19_12350 [Thermoproteota archaeon]